MQFTSDDVNSGLLHSWRDNTAESFHFSLLLPSKQPKMGVNRLFQAKHAKYYQNDWCDSNQILHSNKDHQILVVGRPKFAPQIQNGGRLPFWKLLA